MYWSMSTSLVLVSSKTWPSERFQISIWSGKARSVFEIQSMKIWVLCAGPGRRVSEWSVQRSDYTECRPRSRGLGHWWQLPPPPPDTPEPAPEELEERERGATHQQKFASFYRARDVLPPVGLGSSRRPELTGKWEWKKPGNINLNKH